MGVTPSRSVRCKGGVRIEIFDGKNYFQVKFYPARLDKGGKGRKALYKYFDKDSFRWTERGAHSILVACPKGKWNKTRKRCSVGTIALQIKHPARELAAYKRMCRSGKLGFDNRHSVARIKDIVGPAKRKKKRGRGEGAKGGKKKTAKKVAG